MRIALLGIVNRYIMDHDNFKIELISAPLDAKMVIKNLARFYVYELSRYKTADPTSEFPEDGLYEAYESCFEFDKYWSEPGYFPFIVRVNNELAGFVLGPTNLDPDNSKSTNNL